MKERSLPLAWESCIQNVTTSHFCLFFFLHLYNDNLLMANTQLMITPATQIFIYLCVCACFCGVGNRIQGLSILGKSSMLSCTPSPSNSIQRGGLNTRPPADLGPWTFLSLDLLYSPVQDSF